MAPGDSPGAKWGDVTLCEAQKNWALACGPNPGTRSHNETQFPLAEREGYIVALAALGRGTLS